METLAEKKRSTKKARLVKNSLGMYGFIASSDDQKMK